MDPQWGIVEYFKEQKRLGRIKHLGFSTHGRLDNLKEVLDLIGENFPKGQVLVSLMRQYTPISGMRPPLDRTVTEEEYQSVLSWMFLNDLQGFTQESESATTAYIPNF